jgi:DNA-binding CsgD family transcriptional regulator
MKNTKTRERFADSVPLSEEQTLLWALLSAPTVGIAVFDKQLRFRAVNKAFASMDGIAQEAHLGKTISKVLGKAAIKLEPPLRYVLSSGRDVSNLGISYKLPNRKDVGYWTGNCFPMGDASGLKQQVGVVVLETTEQTNLQRGLLGVIERLFRNLLLSADHSDALVGQIMQGSLMTISDSEANHNRPALTKSSNQENAKVVPLTPREREVIKFLADGHGNKGTAAILGISVKTVEAHKERIMLKLGLHTNTELLHYAIKNKILGLSDM